MLHRLHMNHGPWVVESKVIDDDDVRVTAAQHAVASTAQALAESDEVPVDTGDGRSKCSYELLQLFLDM